MRRIGAADTEVIDPSPRRRAARATHAGEKPRWYLPGALAAGVAGVAVPVALVFGLSGQPRPVACALTATLLWLGVQAAQRRFDSRLIGESRSVLATVQDWLILLGLLALARTATGEHSDPIAALLALLPALVLTAAYRMTVHVHLNASRRAAYAVRRVLVVGEPGAADAVVGHLASRTDHAYVVVGVVPVGDAANGSGAPEAARLGAVPPGAPRWDADAVLGAAVEHAAELVLVVPGPLLSGARLRSLAWAVHESGLPMAVLPGVTEVAPRRMRLSVAAGLAVLHIAPPLRRGTQVTLKSALDRIGAAVGLAALAPLFAVLAVAIRAGSTGPVFHRQQRLGRDGEPFTMWKFRTMVADAEARKAELAAVNEHEGPLFKMRKDPRVTRVGSLLRRTSLDELPQLINVLRGEMSLVGPRPPLPEEAERYDEVEARRLAVKPGMTGLWQVSGRSDLSWDETVALDLQYVENWSLTYDVDVMARTLKAVVDGRGAY